MRVNERKQQVVGLAWPARLNGEEGIEKESLKSHI